MEEHNKVRMSPGYERWPKWKKALFESHIFGHQAALQAQMETMQGVGQPEAPLENPQAQEAEGAENG